MTEKEIAAASKLLDGGECVVLGEWRGVVPETIKYTDKQGRAASFGRLLHTVELGDGQRVESVKVAQSVADGQAPETVQVQFKRGQRVAVEVDSMTIEKGTRQVRAASIVAV